jgi:putative ABC transport system permease protein
MTTKHSSDRGPLPGESGLKVSEFPGQAGKARRSAKRSYSFKEPALIALDTLRAHKLRSFLTLLGVILAVFTLLLVVSLVSGSNKYIADKVANFGANVFIVAQYPVVTSQEEFVRLQRKNRKVTWEDYDFVRENMGLAKNVGFRHRRVVKGKYKTKDMEEVQLQGVTANMGEIGLQEPEFGRYITDTDNEHRGDVAMIGHELAKRLFEGENPLGKLVMLDGKPYEVVGVAKELGTTFGQSQDAFAVIPVMTYRKYYGTLEPGAIQVQAVRQEMMQPAEDEARMLMRAHRHIAPKEEDNFGVIEPSAIMGLWTNLTGTLASVSIGVVAVFLVIAAIVIMNVMLASVTERTREIGVRKSLGATRRDVLLQFLVEASVMAAVGGIIGVTAAYAASFLIDVATPLPMHVPLYAVVISVGVSSLVGLVSGVYPAHKASKLDPIEALRFEA